LNDRVRAAARSLPFMGMKGCVRGDAAAWPVGADEWTAVVATGAAATVADPKAGIAATSTTQTIQGINRLVAIIGTRLH
jgi:hypothetical protein